MSDHQTTNQPTPPGTDRAQAIRDELDAWKHEAPGTFDHKRFTGAQMQCALNELDRVLDQLRDAQDEADKLRMFLGDASPKSNALRQRVDAEMAADKARITELESALQTAQSWIDAAVKACASRGCSQKEYEAARVQRERAEQAEARITELESVLQAAQEEREHWKRTAEQWRVQASEDRAALQARASSGATTCHSCGGELHCDFCYSRPIYDPAFGDDRDCACGHPYRRHFDGYEQNRPVGCKYCGCTTWKDPQTGAAPPVATTAGEMEARAILDYIADALDGKPVSDFALSFPIVRAVADLKAAPVATTGLDAPLTLTITRCDLPEDAARVLRDRAWDLYDDGASPSTPPPPDAPTRG